MTNLGHITGPLWRHPFINTIMLILLSQNEQGISALDLQKHIFPSGSSPMKNTFPWMQRHCVSYYKGEQFAWNKPIWSCNDSVHTSSAVALGFESRSVQSKDYNISSWCYQVNINRSTQKNKKMSNMDPTKKKLRQNSDYNLTI
jgi:hypothetical protein